MAQAKQDFYEQLGVERSASPEEIKKDERVINAYLGAHFEADDKD